MDKKDKKDRKYQIFVSSTYTDLRNARNKVRDAIHSINHFPVGMEFFGAANEGQWEIIKETLDTSDYFVLIIGHRYGTVISKGPDKGISYTEKEYRYAKEKGIPILAFILDDNVSTRLDKIEQDHIQKFKQFKKTVQNGKQVASWKTPDELAQKVTSSLVNEFNRTPRYGWSRNTTKIGLAQENEICKTILESETTTKKARMNLINNILYKESIPTDIKKFCKDAFSAITHLSGILIQIKHCLLAATKEDSSDTDTELFVSLAIKIATKDWIWADHADISQCAQLNNLLKNPNSTFNATLDEASDNYVYYNDKRKGYQEGHYFFDAKDHKNRDVGSIICWHINLDCQDNPLAQAVLSISTYGKQLSQSEDDKQVEYLYTNIIRKLILEQFENEIRFDLALMYLEQLSNTQTKS